MAIIVKKFGGTSMSDLQCIKRVATIIQSEYIKGNHHIVVVVSAMSGTTNGLIAQCTQVSNLDFVEALREYDAVISSGEIVTASLLTLELQKMSLNAKSMQGWQVPIKTNGVHGNAQVLDVPLYNIRKILDNGSIPVITGFQGIEHNNNVTTLGKGGSDITATIIAAALGAERCDIYTDVEGVYSADPRIVADAKKINQIDIDQLCVLCSSGAKVLHPRAALATKRYGFTLRILSSFNNNEGTIIQIKNRSMEQPKITAITSNDNLFKIDIQHQGNHDFLINLCREFLVSTIQIEQMSNIDMFNSYFISHVSNKEKCTNILKNLIYTSQIVNYHFNIHISTVTIVGYSLKNNSNLICQIIDVLENIKIQIISFQADDMKISILVNEQDSKKVIQLLHQKLLSLI